jgi:anti-sigma factor RsiW
MKNDVTGKPLAGRQDHHDPHDAAAQPPIGFRVLKDYIDDNLPPSDLARVEKALRDSAQLRAQLEEVRNYRDDFHLHTLGAMWLRGRLTCANRQQLGSYLLDALDPELASYLKFHLEVVECPFCRANLADLEAQAKSATASDVKHRRNRIIASIQHQLKEEGRER